MLKTLLISPLWFVFHKLCNLISLGCHNTWKLEPGLDEIIAKTVEKLSINSNIFKTKPREMVVVSIYILGIKQILQIVDIKVA